jgi:hypothetical protein
MKRINLAWAITLAAATGGCASTTEVRNLSDGTGVYVTSLRNGTDEFVAAQSRLNAENELHLQSLEARAAEAEGQVARQRLAWTSGARQSALDTQKLASNVTAADVVAELKPRSVEPAKVSFAGGKGYSDAVEALSQVSAKPSTLAVLRGLVTYAMEVRTSYEDIQKKATDASAGTAGQAAATDSEATGTALSVPTTPTPDR